MEVVRVGGGLEDNMAGGDESDNNQDNEIQDRKLVCMVIREDRLWQHLTGSSQRIGCILQKMCF